MIIRLNTHKIGIEFHFYKNTNNYTYMTKY